MPRTRLTPLQRIAGIRTKCATPGWDSYGAEPVSSATCELAIEILALLGDGWEVVPTCNGSIEFSRDDDRDTVKVHRLDSDD